MSDDFGGGPGAPRILLGSARSGTTWLQDALAEANALRTSFEPLHAEAVPAARDFAFRFVPPERDWPELEAFLRDVLSGRGTRMWADLRVRPDRFLRPSISWYLLPLDVAARSQVGWRSWRRLRRLRGRPILCKLIRANLMAGWLHARLGARTLLVVRHPGAVVASQAGADPAFWHQAEDQLQLHLEDEPLRDALPAPAVRRLETPLDADELRAALWCIENVPPLARRAEWSLPVVHYERLLLRDREEWRRAAAALGFERLPDAAVLDRPSQMASKDFRQRSSAGPRVGRWMERLAPDRKARIASMLDVFGVTVYRMDDPMPREISA